MISDFIFLKLFNIVALVFTWKVHSFDFPRNFAMYLEYSHKTENISDATVSKVEDTGLSTPHSLC